MEIKDLKVVDFSQEAKEALRVWVLNNGNNSCNKISVMEKQMQNYIKKVGPQ